jgi:cell division protease FtsH
VKQFKGAGFYVIIFVLFMLVLLIIRNTGGVESMEYSIFTNNIKQGEVQNVDVQGNKATVYLKMNPNKPYIVELGSQDAFRNEFKEEISSGELIIDFKEVAGTPWWLSMLPMLVLVVVFILFWVFFVQQSQGGGGSGGRVMNFGKSRAKLNTDEKNKVTFDDVAGAEEEKEELKEIVDFLKEPKKFIELGARIPKGVLLVGPPGTGKTLLAKAIAGEAGVPFFSISGSDFVEMFVGVGASRVRDLFEQAKKSVPCIVFIDEIDAVGRHRGAGLGGGHDEREQTLNQLLVEMDGFGVNEGVIIVAATNRPDILDPALLRPGRFDRRVHVGIPDIKGREEILKVHSRGKPLADDVSLSDISKITAMFTGADLENLMNEAALLAARKDKKRIEYEDIKESVFKVMMGPEKKSKVITEEDKKLTAYHEAGHAIAVKVVSTTDKVDRVTIIPAGAAGGYTSFRPDEEKSYKTKAQLLEMIIIALGGKAAEEVVLGEISTGAYGDLKSANKVARNMVTKFGMSDELGNMVFNNESDEVFIGRDYGHTKNYSEDLAGKIDNEIKKIIDSSYEKAKTIISENINKLNALAEKLLEQERVEGPEFEKIFAEA